MPASDDLACGTPPFDRLRANGEGLSAPHHFRDDAAAEQQQHLGVDRDAGAAFVCDEAFDSGDGINLAAAAAELKAGEEIADGELVE